MYLPKVKLYSLICEHLVRSLCYTLLSKLTFRNFSELKKLTKPKNEP